MNEFFRTVLASTALSLLFVCGAFAEGGEKGDSSNSGVAFVDGLKNESLPDAETASRKEIEAVKSSSWFDGAFKFIIKFIDRILGVNRRAVPNQDKLSTIRELEERISAAFPDVGRTRYPLIAEKLYGYILKYKKYRDYAEKMESELKNSFLKNGKLTRKEREIARKVALELMNYRGRVIDYIEKIGGPCFTRDEFDERISAAFQR